MTTAVKDRPTKVRKTQTPTTQRSQAQATPALVMFVDVPIQEIPCGCLRRHPFNRSPSAAAIESLVESLARLGQMEAVIVRPVVDECIDGPCYQILSGETRWLAAQRIGWGTIAARVIDADDADALKLVAEANEARKDLTTCEKARLIERLCLPPAEGGSGLTREAAGRLFGLESGAAASNLVKLLDAPVPWQQRLDQPDVDCNGDTVTIHQGTVREVAKIAAVSEAVATAIEAAYQTEMRGDSTLCEQLGHTRDEQLQWVADVVHDAVRVLSEPRYYGYQYGGDHPCYLDLQDAELLARLEIVELPIGGKKGNDLVRCATNVKLFDELQIAEIERRQASKSKGGDRATSKAATAELTPKELRKIEREKRTKADQQLAAFAREWQHELLRAAMAETLDGAQAAMMLPWLLTEATVTYSTRLSAFAIYAAQQCLRLWRLPAPPKRKRRTYEQPSPAAELLAIATAKCDDAPKALAYGYQQKLAALLLWPSDEAGDGKLIATGLPEQMPYYDKDETEQWAAWLGVELGQAWRDGAVDGSVERALVAQLLQRHTTAQLSDLAAELGVTLTASGKAACVSELLAAHRPGTPLPLPQLLQDKPAKATWKAKR